MGICSCMYLLEPRSSHLPQSQAFYYRWIPVVIAQISSVLSQGLSQLSYHLEKQPIRTLYSKKTSGAFLPVLCNSHLSACMDEPQRLGDYAPN